MAYSEYLTERVRTRLEGKGTLIGKSMMGGLIFMLNDSMCVGVDIDKATGLDRLMVRVGKLPYEELLKKDASREMNFTGKVMRGFLFIDPEGFDSEEDLDFWVNNAVEFNRLLAKKV